MQLTKLLVAASFLVSLNACQAEGDAQPATRLNQIPATSSGPVVFVGDSITQLWPLEEYMQGAINAGISGNETGQMLNRFDADVLSYSPSIVIILGGTNDIRHLDSADVTNIWSMVDKAKAAGARVIVGTIPPMDVNLGAYPDAEKQLIPVLNDKIRKGAVEHGYDVVDYYQAMVAPLGVNPMLYADAYLHPNQAGYDVMWSRLDPILSGLTSASALTASSHR